MLPDGATRVSGAGSTSACGAAPGSGSRLSTTKARKSTLRGTSSPLTSVGCVDSFTRSWATQREGASCTCSRRSSSSAALASGPMVTPAPP